MACILTKGAIKDCQNIKPGGIKPFIQLYMYDDWRTMVNSGAVVRDGVGRITGITNPLGVKAYKFEVWDESGIVPTNPLIEQEGNIDMYDHMISLSIIANDQEDRNNVDAMRASKVVAVILQNTGWGAAYGEEQGLKLTANNFNPQDPTAGNNIPIELKTANNGAKETRMPCVIFDTDAATTEALIKGLDIAGV